MSDRSTISPDVIADHGLTLEEYQRILVIMGRPPNLTELGVFSVMWSEHCSYKSSRKWLKTLPTEAPHVIQGPGENAGVIDIGDGLACVFKIESHNHPSSIEPFQGAATGVGGIMRDIFTMGGRPVATMNALRFGDPDHPKSRHLVSGVVAGIASYGNCMGVPTVGGECEFDAAYNDNILVNAMTVGVAPADRIFYSAATGVGNPVVYVGSKTGRDGIHGATMASAEFDDDSEGKRPTVQVGDPFTEKLLLEACLELMATDIIVAIQDMGAAGLTSSSVEMSSKGRVGIDLDLDSVPVRECGMTAYEILLSESQERMLMVLKPGREDQARAIFEKWELDFAIIGTITDTGRMVARMGGETVADILIDPMMREAPEYDRPQAQTPGHSSVDPVDVIPPGTVEDALLTLVGSPNQASKRWIWEQYDHLVMGRTAVRPGGNAAVVSLPDSPRALAMTTDCTPRYCLADPVEGGKQAVAEAWRNLTAVGATPLAVTNNLNFGNPERPLIMGQFVGAVQGISAACRALDFPVVSGNVSFYNETSGAAILPTPVIGGVGVLEDGAHVVGRGTTGADRIIILIGKTVGHLGASRYLRDVLNCADGPPPPVDLVAERLHGNLIRNLIQEGTVTACHDLSDGGLALALSEMVLAGQAGIALDNVPDTPPLHAWLFGEDQGRYVVETTKMKQVLAAAQANGAPAMAIGQTVAEPALTLRKSHPISVSRLEEAYEGWLPAWINRKISTRR